MVGFQQIWVFYKMLNEIYTVQDIKKKFIQMLFHKMINKSDKCQGCTSIHMGMAKYLEVPGRFLTVDTWKCCK